jgi:hypothetical protein
LQGTNPALKQKAVVAIDRQLIVDLWRLQKPGLDLYGRQAAIHAP